MHKPRLEHNIPALGDDDTIVGSSSISISFFPGAYFVRYLYSCLDVRQHFNRWLLRIIQITDEIQCDFYLMLSFVDLMTFEYYSFVSWIR